MHQGDLAREHCLSALSAADWHGECPTVGVLRTLAWAHRLQGRHDLADGAAEKIDDYGEWITPLVERLASEARGMPIRDGEVY
jgi:hypothetical protein